MEKRGKRERKIDTKKIRYTKRWKCRENNDKLKEQDDREMNREIYRREYRKTGRRKIEMIYN